MTETKEKTSVHAVTIPVSYLEAIAAYNLLKEGLPDQWELEHRTEEDRASMDQQLRETKTAQFSEETFRELIPSLQTHLFQLDTIDPVYQGRKSRLIWNQKNRELLKKLGVA